MRPVVSWDEEPFLLFQDFARDHPPCRDDAGSLPTVATQCRVPSSRARERGEPRDDPELVGCPLQWSLQKPEAGQFYDCGLEEVLLRVIRNREHPNNDPRVGGDLVELLRRAKKKVKVRLQECVEVLALHLSQCAWLVAFC